MTLNNKLEVFEKKIKYKFKDKKNLLNATVHPSYNKGKKLKKNNVENHFERLEFLGDRVLGLSIASLIYNKFTKLNEGDLTKKLSYLVQKNFLYKISIEIEIKKILKFSCKEENKEMSISILSDSVESLIGGIYIDGGFVNSLKFINRIWGPYLNIEESNKQDSKTQLQEISQEKFKILPIYKLLNKDGPPHSPIFTVSLKVKGMKVVKSTGRSIRIAEKNAAKLVLDLLDS